MAIMYDAQVERFEPLLVDGRLYYVQMMVVEPITSNQYYKLGRSRFVCCFTSKTLVHEITTVISLSHYFHHLCFLIDFFNLLLTMICMLVSVSFFSYLLLLSHCN
jgi:hypothetical protein